MLFKHQGILIFFDHLQYKTINNIKIINQILNIMIRIKNIQDRSKVEYFKNKAFSRKMFQTKVIEFKKIYLLYINDFISLSLQHQDQVF